MKKIVAIICGGDTSEHDVSMRSAQGIKSFIDSERYDTFLVEIHRGEWNALLDSGEGEATLRSVVDRNDFSFADATGRRIRPDFCYITIHNYMRSLGVRVADSLVVRRGHDMEVSDDDILKRIGLPCFVKPSRGGSSYGTTKVKSREALRPAIELALKEGEDVMVEAFMQGTEVTCGCYKTESVSHVLPITEVVTKNEFFDYDAKYNGQVDEITPARISERLTERIQTLTSSIYDILGCYGIIRIDYIITEGDVINLLEINTTPGMTPTSFIPQQVRAAGLDISQVMSDIIEGR